MKNENPVVAAPVDAEEGRRVWNQQRLEDRIAAQAKGKALQIVVQGKCKVCKRRSAAVPATKTQVIAWFAEKKTDGFTQYEVRMLTTGVHRKCQRIEDQKKKAARGRKNDDVFVVPLEADKVERVLARRNRRRA